MLAKMPPHAGRIWELVAYLGRYGHQPADVCLAMSVNDLRSLANAVNDLVSEESEAVRRASEK